jgi:hypothetical protein
MEKSVNYTTAKVITDTVHPDVPSSRITTFQVYAPRYLLAEVNTHGVLAKSAASSRAIPIKKRIEMVQREPWVPDAFGKNRPGMQSTELLGDDVQKEAIRIWSDAIEDALEHAARLQELEVHKQYANRVLEPYTYYSGVLTGTEWDNFWWLRISEDADPGFKVLASKMKEAYDASTPVVRPYHLPYITDEEYETNKDLLILMKVAAARCARVSYVSLETGKPTTVAEDLELVKKLTKPTGAHLSPFDHPAKSDRCSQELIAGGNYHWRNPTLHGRFWGWIPYRYDLERQLGITSRRSSFDPFQLQQKEK